MKWKSYILVGASCLSVLLILVGASYYFPMMESLKNIYIGSSKFYEWIVNVLLTIWRASLACGLLANIATSRLWVSLWGRCIALRLRVTLRLWVTLIRLWVALIWLGGRRVACISGIVSRLGLEPWKGEKKKVKVFINVLLLSYYYYYYNLVDVPNSGFFHFDLLDLFPLTSFTLQSEINLVFAHFNLLFWIDKLIIYLLGTLNFVPECIRMWNLTYMPWGCGWCWGITGAV